MSNRCLIYIICNVMYLCCSEIKHVQVNLAQKSTEGPHITTPKTWLVSFHASFFNYFLCLLLLNSEMNAYDPFKEIEVNNLICNNSTSAIHWTFVCLMQEKNKNGKRKLDSGQVFICNIEDLWSISYLLYMFKMHYLHKHASYWLNLYFSVCYVDVKKVSCWNKTYH